LCRRGALLFADNCLQHVSGLGNVRKIDFCLNAFRLSAATPDRLLGRTAAVACRTKMGADFLGLMLLNGAGMRLLLGNAHCLQCIENRLALDFQLSSQIVDSNLTHPPFISSTPSC
jgi:hypothetical protein